jgi:diacylglycerol kinase (ATP)
LCQGPTHILLNPAAGGHKGGRWVQKLKDCANATQMAAEFHSADSQRHMEAIAAAVIRDGAQAVLVAGGDGTLQTLVNVPGARDITIGILPSGSGDDFAAALGLPRNPVAALRALLAGRIRKADLAFARTADGRVRLYCGGGGLGLDAEAARHSSETYRHLTGRARYVLAALRAFRTFVPLTVRVEFPASQDGLIEKRALLAAALNTPTFGAGLRLAPKAKIDDGLLDIVVVEELNLRDVAGIVFDWALGRAPHSRRITTLQAARLRLIPDRPCFFHGDGEILGPAPVEIEAVPQAIRIFAPRQ